MIVNYTDIVKKPIFTTLIFLLSVFSLLKSSVLLFMLISWKLVLFLVLYAVSLVGVFFKCVCKFNNMHTFLFVSKYFLISLWPPFSSVGFNFHKPFFSPASFY